MSSDPNVITSPPQTSPPAAANPQPSLATQAGMVIPDPPSPRRILGMGVGLVGLPVVLFSLLFKIWPPIPWPTGADKAPLQHPISLYNFSLFGSPVSYSFSTSLDERLLL